MPESSFTAGFETIHKSDRCSQCYGKNEPAVVKFVKSYRNGEPRGKFYATDHYRRPRKTQAWWLCAKHAASMAVRYGVEIPMETKDAG